MKIGYDGCEVKIVDGILYIRSETFMLGYLNVFTPIDDEGWYNTEDVVEELGNNYFRILGRGTDVINVGAENVFPGEIEDVILKVDNIKDVIVRGMSKSGYRKRCHRNN